MDQPNTEPNPSEWVNVEDSLPPHNKEVFILRENGKVSTSFTLPRFIPGESQPFDVWHSSLISSKPKITHWQHINQDERINFIQERKCEMKEFVIKLCETEKGGVSICANVSPPNENSSLAQMLAWMMVHDYHLMVKDGNENVYGMRKFYWAMIEEDVDHEKQNT